MSRVCFPLAQSAELGHAADAPTRAADADCYTAARIQTDTEVNARVRGDEGGAADDAR